MFKRKSKEKSRKDLFDQSMSDMQPVLGRSQRDPMAIFTWGAVLIWAGLIFLATNVGMLDSFLKLAPSIPGVPSMFHPEVWCIILIGAGLIVWLGTVIRILIPSLRHGISSGIVLGMILVGVGLGTLYGWEFAWPVLLIGIGIAVLFRSFSRR